ncbi:MAG: DsbA family oxidoreductase [Candidatus Binataceae bacterium]
MALKIQMFSDFICPFCYIGFEVMKGLQPEFGFELQWRGYQIHPEWPAEGIPAQKVREGSSADVRRSAWARISAMADAIGLTMRPPSVLCNSRTALMAAEYAREAGKSAQFEARVYRAYFQDLEDIGDVGVVTRLAQESGIDSGGLDTALKSGKYEMKLKNNALVANRRGVSGVPTFFIGEYPIVGAQSTDVMRQLLKRAHERFDTPN